MYEMGWGDGKNIHSTTGRDPSSYIQLVNHLFSIKQSVGVNLLTLLTLQAWPIAACKLF